MQLELVFDEGVDDSVDAGVGGEADARCDAALSPFPDTRGYVSNLS